RGEHYEATCKFCNKNWKCDIPKKMTAHICNECTKVHASIHKTVLTKFVKEYNSISTNETEEKIEISKLSSSTSNIQEFFENVWMNSNANSHTGSYLASKIKEIMEKIGPRRIAAIVSDSGANINNARSLIKTEYKHIINLRCISHCLNLISKDIIKHQFADCLIRRANIVTTFFKKSHLAHHRISKLIEEKKIKGGGLKSYVSTRWITCHEATDSIVRLSDVLRE
ncbi:3173_t:CDS:2, partial [Diversispora eburnea]